VSHVALITVTYLLVKLSQLRRSVFSYWPTLDNSCGIFDVLLQLTIEDIHTKELLTFDFSRFVGEVGGDISKELPVIRANADVLQG